MTPALPRRPLLLVTILIAGCAKAAVIPEQSRAPAVGNIRPAVIVIRKFAVVPAEVTENQSEIAKATRSDKPDEAEQRKEKIAHDVSDALAERIAKNLQDLDFRTEIENSHGSVKGNALLISGRFIDVDEGNRLHRLVIGFGAGASKLDTQVLVYRTAEEKTQRVLEFKTHAESGKLPGAAVTATAGAVATGGVGLAAGAAEAGAAGAKTYDSSVDRLARKTADQVTAYLSHYFAERGWISAEKAKSEGVNIQPSDHE